VRGTGLKTQNDGRTIALPARRHHFVGARQVELILVRDRHFGITGWLNGQDALVLAV
jgi:hypothetical protein